jgi:hypothetical protein
VTNNKKLAKINLLRLFAKQRVGHDLPTVFVNHGAILAR